MSQKFTPLINCSAKAINIRKMFSYYEAEIDHIQHELSETHHFQKRNLNPKIWSSLGSQFYILLLINVFLNDSQRRQM